MKCSECNRVAHDPSCSSANVSPSAERILSDLIAELRRSAKGYLSPGAYAITVKEQLWLADWAEAQLREIEGEHR